MAGPSVTGLQRRSTAHRRRPGPFPWRGKERPDSATDSPGRYAGVYAGGTARAASGGALDWAALWVAGVTTGDISREGL